MPFDGPDKDDPNHIRHRLRSTTRAAAKLTSAVGEGEPAGPSSSTANAPKTTRVTRSPRKHAALNLPSAAAGPTAQSVLHKTDDLPGRSSRPVRACTIRNRMASQPKPTAEVSARPTKAPRKAANATPGSNRRPPSRARAAAKPRARKSAPDTSKKRDPSKRQRLDAPVQPCSVRLPEERAQTQEVYQRIMPKKRPLMREFSPVAYTDGEFLSSLYVDLASDDDIVRFLREPDSGFAIVEQEVQKVDRVLRSNQSASWAEAESDDESEADSDYPESEDEEGAKYNAQDLARPGRYPKGRWTQIPAHSAVVNSEISASLTQIIQRIVEAFPQPTPAGVSRTVVDTSCAGLLKTRPDIVIRATGPSFEVPSTRQERILRTTSEEGKADFVDLGFTNAASIIEVRPESTKGKDKDIVAQLSLFCSEIWAHQPNREFIRALLVTETTVRLVHFDRGGAFVTPFFNYHTNPHIFVRLVLGLTSMDEKVLGFDTSIQWTINPLSGRKVAGTIALVDEHSKKSITYTMYGIEPRFAHRDIRGRGTTCWAVRNPEGGRYLIIKDAWRVGNGPSECVYLDTARGLEGVGQMVACEDDLAQTDDFRPASYRGHHAYQSYTKARIVMPAYGQSILEYKSRYQLVAALKDAIKGYHALVKARILHRDISAGNILLGVNDEEGSRGLVIDLDVAVRLDRDASGVASDAVVGTRFYQSIAVLWGYTMRRFNAMEPHDYLDDLESFFYVLCQAMISRVSQGQCLEEHAEVLLAGWPSPNPKTSQAHKFEFVRTPFRRSFIDVNYWGEACVRLLKHYHAFIQDVNIKKDVIRAMEEVDFECQVALLRDIRPDIDTLYGELDDLFQETLDALKTEEPQLEARLLERAATVSSPDVLPNHDNKLKRRLDEVDT